jgi:hypothetical protein
MDEPSSSLFQKLNATLTLSSVLWLAAAWLLYRLSLAIYNISPLHPLSHFPGPKIAAASYLYEAYFDWWLVGRYGKVIADMHKAYGPIVRYVYQSPSPQTSKHVLIAYISINPDELHCSDPLFTDEIYAGPGRPRDKWVHQLNTGGAGPVAVTGFSTVNHDLHRVRKAPLSRFFSRQQMLKLESEVHDFADQTCAKMLKCKGVFDVKDAFNCFTADVISQYCFGEPMGFVAQEGWEPNFATWVKSFFASAYMMRHNVLARKMAQFLPFMADYLGEDIKAVMKVMNVTIPGYISAALKNPSNGRVFAEVMGDAGSMTPEEKYRFNGEGFNFLLAGTETTAVRYLHPPPLSPSQLICRCPGHPNSPNIPPPLHPIPLLHSPHANLHRSLPELARSRKNPPALGHAARMPAHDAGCIAPQCAHRAHRRLALRQRGWESRCRGPAWHAHWHDEHD